MSTISLIINYLFLGCMVLMALKLLGKSVKDMTTTPSKEWALHLLTTFSLMMYTVVLTLLIFVSL